VAEIAPKYDDFRLFGIATILQFNTKQTVFENLSNQSNRNLAEGLKIEDGERVKCWCLTQNVDVLLINLLLGDKYAFKALKTNCRNANNPHVDVIKLISYKVQYRVKSNCS